MKFDELKERLTGISCPFFGISWNPPQAERTIARRIIRFLEDRRVFFAPYHWEVFDHCVHSVLEIRKYLTEELQNIPEESNLFSYAKAMRIACRTFLDHTQQYNEETHRGHWHRNEDLWPFVFVLGELRGTFGNMLAQMAAAYGIDIEDDLASILPGEDDSTV